MPCRPALRRLGACLHLLTLALAGCGGDDSNTQSPNPYLSRPGFLAAEPQRSDYDGQSAGLLTGRAASLDALIAYEPGANPGAAERRTLALKTSYTGLLDTSAAGGFGRYYGRLLPGANQGSEYLARIDDGSGQQNVAVIVGVPASFNPRQPCLVAVPSSGSRPVYGELGTIGEWAYNKGCAVAATDKGTGMGLHDLDRDQAYTLDGEPVTAGQRKDLGFNANLLGEDLGEFRRRQPQHLALKHAHGQRNPEKDWGLYTLQALQTAFYVLNRQFPEADLRPENTLVIAASISNGGGAVLRAAEQDSQGLIDAVVAAEPQVNLPAQAAAEVRRGGQTVALSGRPLYDYTSLAALYQPCAAQAGGPSSYVIAAFGSQRCASLKALGLLEASDAAGQAAEALQRLHAYGWEPESDLLHDAHSGFEFTELVAHTYANAYARASVSESLCGYGVAGIDASYRTPVAPGAAAMSQAWATGGGLGFLAGAYNLINENSVGGPALYLLSVSPGSGTTDLNLDGAACLRRLATGAAVGRSQPSATELAQAARLRQGLDEVRVSGRLRGKPTILLHGRSDALLPVNHTSRPYAALQQGQEPGSPLRYYEVTDANHFDALVGLYPRTLVPLHVYTLRALDLMYEHLRSGAALPPSQVVRARARASASAMLDDSHLPAIAAQPAAADLIALQPGRIDVPH